MEITIRHLQHKQKEIEMFLHQTVFIVFAWKFIIIA